MKSQESLTELLQEKNLRQLIRIKATNLNMNRQFIPDREIVLSKDTDLLNTSTYADNLTNLIQQAPKEQVFTIGLFGSWGSGKSSIIETSKKSLTCSEDVKVKFITYDAWKYANDSFRRMFLLRIQQELKQGQTEVMQRFYQSESVEAEPKTYVSTNYLGILCLALLALLIIINCLPISFEMKVPIFTGLSLLGVLITIFGGIFQKLKIQINKPIVFAPEQFEECFRDMISKALKKRNIVNNTYTKIVDYVKVGECSITNLDQLVLVIDNIDRCSSSQAYNLLTDIKTFLCDEKFNLVFVIPVDDEALRKHILNSTHSENTDECARDKEEFLRKFFNVTLRIKPHQPTEMYEFTQKLNTKYALGFSSATINIASKEYAKNPRRVIQLFNNLSAELTNYDDAFASKYETLICKILIIREEYNDFYQELLKDYTLLSKVDLSDKKRNPELIRLLSDTRSYTSNYDGHVLSRILTNSDSQFADIPANIRNLIDAHNTIESNTELSEWINAEDSKIEQFVGYCLYNIEKAIKRQLWDSEYKAYCEFIAEANSVIQFTREQNIRLSEKIKPHIEKLIPAFSNPTQIVTYANYLHTQKLSYLLGYIISYLKSNKEKTNEIWSKYLGECISQCNNKTLSDLGDIFTSEYKKGKYDVTTLSKEQIKALVKDDLLSYIIDKWSTIEENQYITDFIFISDKINITESVSIKVYDKINTILGDLRGLDKTDLLNKLTIINKLTENLLIGQNQESIQKLYNLITGQRTMPNPSYPNHRHYDKQVRLLEECTDISDINIIARFIATTYKVTRGRINGASEFELLRTIDETTTLNNILWLKERFGYTLYRLASHLVNYSLYNNEDLMTVYQAHFLEEYNNAPILKEDELNHKLDNMLKYAIQYKDNKMFSWLNDISSKNNRIKTILIPIISARPIGEIQTLPNELMDLAINSVDENNIESYRKFTDFLRCLASSGSASQKQYLVKLIIKMLDEKEDIEKVISIIKSYKQLAKTYCDRIISTLNCIIEDNSDTTIIDMCSDAIEHLISLNKSISKAKKQRSA